MERIGILLSGGGRMFEENLMNKEFECEFCGKKTATLKEYFIHYQECSGYQKKS